MPATLNVPEIWRFDGQKVVPLHRQKNGRYREASHSLAFPELSIGEFNRFLAMALQSQHDALLAFRDGLRR